MYSKCLLQMQEKITLLKNDREEEEEDEDDANQSILVEKLQHCSPEKVPLTVLCNWVYCIIQKLCLSCIVNSLLLGTSSVGL